LYTVLISHYDTHISIVMLQAIGFLRRGPQVVRRAMFLMMIIHRQNEFLTRNKRITVPRHCIVLYCILLPKDGRRWILYDVMDEDFIYEHYMHINCT
jgi:hypothetical protein